MAKKKKHPKKPEHLKIKRRAKNTYLPLHTIKLGHRIMKKKKLTTFSEVVRRGIELFASIEGIEPDTQ